MKIVKKEILDAHRGGKIEIRNRVPVRDRKDLPLVYTPGVAEVSTAIHEEPSIADVYTMRGNSVLIATDGSAVLGLGDIGPLAALPVMEGKAMLFREFGGINAFPICIDAREPADFVRTVKNISPAFGAINLEDISAPRCFEIEEMLQGEVGIPVFHDDQHGTAVVVLAGVINAMKVVGKVLPEIKVVISGAGAAGTACARILVSAGVGEVIVCDRAGAIYSGRIENMNPAKEKLAGITNPSRVKGGLHDALKGADLFLGVSAPGVLNGEWIRDMGRDAVIFAMANPIPEIMPDEAARYAGIVATGRSDYPNQINNCLCFPGFFRGLLDGRAARVTEGMKMAAASAIASRVSDEQLGEGCIIPDIFDRSVHEEVARAVVKALESQVVI